MNSQCFLGVFEVVGPLFLNRRSCVRIAPGAMSYVDARTFVLALYPVDASGCVGTSLRRWEGLVAFANGKVEIASHFARSVAFMYVRIVRSRLACSTIASTASGLAPLLIQGVTNVTRSKQRSTAPRGLD